MAGRPGASKSRSVGRYDLVVEMAKSQLGSLWAATVPAAAGLEPRMVRRLVTPTVKNAATLQQAEAAAAHWSVDFGVDQAMNVLEVVHEPTELALVSGYVPGETLRALLRLANFKRKDIPSRVAARITLDVCQALLAGETRALAASLAPEQFYGGLLPDSIVVGSDGIARLLDMGVAAAWRSGSNALSHPEVAAYAAPEQFNSESLDSRTDVFILGALLWEMLSGGKRLFVGSSGKAVSERVLNHPAPKVTSSHPGQQIPAAMQALLSKMLERDPRKRFRSVDDLRSSLESMDADVALPIEVSDFVTTFAHNSLNSRERVLERALNRAVPTSNLTPAPSASRAPAPQPPKALADGSASSPPPPPARARQSSAGRLSSPQLPSLEGPGASPSLKPEARGGARPLPLPMHARLGARTSSPDGVLPPPPPPVVAKNPKSSAPSTSNDDDSSSVRAADILRALAVEDAPPASDEMPTVRPVQPAAPAPAPAPATSHDVLSAPSAPRPPQQTLAGHASPTPPAAGQDPSRPQLQTLTGYGAGEGLQQPQAAQSGQSDEGQTLRAPAPDATAGANTDPAVAAAPIAAAQETVSPSTSVAPREPETVQAETASARTSDEAMTGLPARQSGVGGRRLPMPLLAGLGGGALLLLIGLVFALGGRDGGDPEPAAPVRTASSNPVAETAKSEPPAAEKKPEPPASKPSDAAATDQSSDSSDSEEEGEEEHSGTAIGEPATPAAKPVARGWSAPPPAAPKPTSAPKKKMRAKRTFIPSGI
jgi:serine/threonine-protein kinase